MNFRKLFCICRIKLLLFRIRIENLRRFIVNLEIQQEIVETNNIWKKKKKKKIDRIKVIRSYLQVENTTN